MPVFVPRGFFTLQCSLAMFKRMDTPERTYNAQAGDGHQSAPEQSSLLLGDCIAVLPQLPDASVDCILTDPPYGIMYKSRSRSLPLRSIANDNCEAYDVLRHALALTWSKLKDGAHVYIFSNWQAYTSMSAVIRKYFTIKNVLIWEKNAWSRGDLKGNYGYMYEMVIYAQKVAPSAYRRFLNGKREGNILKYKKLPTNAMQHPTEKPVALLTYLIGKSTAEGETVLDMFMGSGSTCVAAKHMGRNYVGIEIEPIWYEVAQKRLEGRIP